MPTYAINNLNAGINRPRPSVPSTAAPKPTFSMKAGKTGATMKRLSLSIGKAVLRGVAALLTGGGSEHVIKQRALHKRRVAGATDMTLDKLLQPDHVLAKQLQALAKKEFASDHHSFLQKVNEFKKTQDPQKKQKIFQDLADNYVEDHATNGINLSFNDRNRLRNAVNRPDAWKDNSTFDNAYTKIYGLMGSTFSRFKQDINRRPFAQPAVQAQRHADDKVRQERHEALQFKQAQVKGIKETAELYVADAKEELSKAKKDLDNIKKNVHGPKLDDFYEHAGPGVIAPGVRDPLKGAEQQLKAAQERVTGAENRLQEAKTHLDGL